jgi:hypothetical protein
MENENKAFEDTLKTVRFTFDYQEDATGEVDRWGTNKNVTMAFDFEQGDCWHHVLYQFAKFLEGVGYVDVVGRVRVQGSPFTDTTWDIPFKVFYDEEEKKSKTDELEEMLEEHLNNIVDFKHMLKTKYENTTS